MTHSGWRRTGVTAAVLLFFLLAVQSAGAGNEEIGVVVLHGKWGKPGGTVLTLAQKLAGEGFRVSSPEMPWSGDRLYDRGADDAMAEIDAAVVGLQAKGARKIFIAGHSLGAAAVLRYGTRPSGAAGFIVLAPGHFPEGQAFRSKLADSLRKAEEMVRAGKGSDKAWFDDLNSGSRYKSVRTTARIYLDYFGPDGPMNFQRNVEALRPGVPILWVVGTEEEKGPRTLGDRGWAKIPGNPGNLFVEVSAGHLNTADRAVEAVITWIVDMAWKIAP